MKRGTQSKDDAIVHCSESVEAALADGQPVVALESTIICHGMPYPDNVRAALDVEATVREAGATPATVAVIGGRLCAGLDAAQIEALGARGPSVPKLSRRDIPLAVATQSDGATTVAATMIVAELAGIPVFATGGIGGVHRDVNETLDISADLTELARSNVAVVCAGVKSVLDIGRTLEALETLGVPVLGYRSDELPAFYARSSGRPVDRRVDDAATIADILYAKWSLGLEGGVVIGNPVPASHAMPADRIDAVIEDALSEMRRRGIRGKATTPFLLERIAELTGGKSLEANVALVRSNAQLAADIAVAYRRRQIQASADR